ncbi:MAG: hypothetical protein JOY81_09110 [Alphaproteobacteria bacterium]|nr:hypothetical protein [Alphaproteobacteria bacterium]
MTVRKKMVLAYVAAAVLFVVALKVLAALGAIRLLYLVAGLAAVAGLVAYAAVLKCPHCGGRPFVLRLVPLFFVPKTCATCDRDLFD